MTACLMGLVMTNTTTAQADPQDGNQPQAEISPEKGNQPQTEADPKEVKSAKSADEFLILPLRFYRLKSADLADVDCRELTDDDLKRIVGKVNVVWASAGIYWNLEKIEELPAENLARLKLAELADENADAEAKTTTKKPHALFRVIIPAATRKGFDGFRVYYIHDFDVNGVYFGRREAIVKETAALRSVKGGIDEPLPRVTSHELGHALGLPHRQDRFNLLASGTSGTLLNTNEIVITRENAANNPACLRFGELQKKADDATDIQEKTRFVEAVKMINSLAGQPVHPVGTAYMELQSRLATETAK